MPSPFDRPADVLAAVGAVLCLVGVALAARRRWALGALATTAGGLGLAYLLTGLAVRDCADPSCHLRRALATLPLLGGLVLAATVGSDALADGEVGLATGTALEAAAVTLLLFPTGLGYVVGAADDAPTRRRTVGVGAASALAGGVLMSHSILYFGLTAFADLGISVAAGLVLPAVGAIPSFLLARRG